ncbi:hypothetical protein CDAR_532031 [Caerostris darwini]|uniref:Uncharacterized protein n=1 Tax=Caerostris darwini TaxID=1538125 RepID=A0AAV4R2Z4_9ARAC|nr:hypothetical protein CDAR_532031 [Caerostris darwini]
MHVALITDLAICRCSMEKYSYAVRLLPWRLVETPSAGGIANGQAAQKSRALKGTHGRGACTPLQMCLLADIMSNMAEFHVKMRFLLQCERRLAHKAQATFSQPFHFIRPSQYGSPLCLGMATNVQ